MKKHNMRMFSLRAISVSTVGLALAIAMPVFAQQQSDRSGTASGERTFQPEWVTIAYDYDNDGAYDAYETVSMDKLHKNASQQQQNMQNKQSQDQGRSASQFITAEPSGWVTLAYDYDNDGAYDAVEMVRAYDLQQRKAQQQFQPSQKSQQGQRMQQQFQSSQQSQQGQRMAQQKQQGGQGQQQRQSLSQQMRLDPQGWVTVAYDYDRDGTYDAFEMITMYDLQKRRAQQQDGQRFSSRQQGDRSGFSSAENQSKQKGNMIQGRLLETGLLNIVNSDQQHMLAKVQTRGGKSQVIDLGPKENLDRINLQKGDNIKVFGVEGSIDKNYLLVADRLQVDGVRVAIDRSKIKPLTKLDATVLATRTMSQNQQTNRLARVELDNGIRTVVNLGPASKLPQLSQGQQIQLLARISEIDGQKALIAERLRTEGKTYRINWNTGENMRRQASQ